MTSLVLEFFSQFTKEMNLLWSFSLFVSLSYSLYWEIVPGRCTLPNCARELLRRFLICLDPSQASILLTIYSIDGLSSAACAGGWYCLTCWWSLAETGRWTDNFQTVAEIWPPSFKEQENFIIWT